MPARYETLTSWINEKGWRRGAELGILDGRTYLYLLDRCPDLHLIGVDIWDDGFKEGPTKSGEKCFCDYCNETRRNRKGKTTQGHERFVCDKSRTYGGRGTIYKMQTAEAAALVPDGSLDFVFVDADHSTEGVSRDIEIWRSKLCPGGWMIGHDFNMRGVRDGIWQHFAPGDVSIADDHVWYAVP